MKQIIATILIISSFLSVSAQEPMEKVMEQRAREMHRVISLTDQEQWRKFIKENYTQKLIDKPMRAAVQEGDRGATSTTEVKSSDNLEAKVNMFGRLHNDFGGSKIVSIKSTAETLKMVLDNGEGLTGTFQLKFDKNKPYLIDGIGIVAGN
jgi:hypothetical protein